MCADITDSATCATQAATGNCMSDNVNMEQNCMASCDLCGKYKYLKYKIRNFIFHVVSTNNMAS